MSESNSAPSLLLTLTEGHRAIGEMALLLSAWPLLRLAPRGDGHAVLVLPGFMADDASTLLLRRFLDRQGYRSHPWGFGRNLGPRGDLMDRVIERARTLAADAPITLIGQSLGGVYAREIARAMPDRVRQVVTLGSPFGSQNGSGTNPGIRRLYEMATGHAVSVEDIRAGGEPLGDLGAPPPVPCTAVFSRLDGVASWRICIERAAPNTDNIEIAGSHCGMALNPMVMWILADRLRHTRASWRPLDRSGLGRLLYGSGTTVARPAAAAA